MASNATHAPNGAADVLDDEDMIGKRVEFQTDVCSFGEGKIEAYNQVTGQVTVRDDDGNLWSGHEEFTTLLEKTKEEF